jgi:hypothetical protein
VNLSDEPLLVTFLTERNFLAFLLSYIIVSSTMLFFSDLADGMKDPRSICADLACMILANLSGATGPLAPILASLTIPVAPGANSEDGLLATLARCGSCVAPSPRLNVKARDVLAIPILVDAFVDGARPREVGSGRKGSLHFLSSVFANISAVSMNSLNSSCVCSNVDICM